MRSCIAVLCVVAACAGDGESPSVGGPDAGTPDAGTPDAGRQGRLLDVPMPGITPAGYTIYEVHELQNDPRAGHPSYVFLDYLVDAVRLPGPTFPMTAEQEPDLYVIEDAHVEVFQWGAAVWQDGIRIIINDRLRFDMKIEDFEEEITPLALVEMSYFEGEVRTSFIMLGNGADGVAHEIETTAFVDDASIGTTSGPHTLEVRGNPGL